MRKSILITALLMFVVFPAMAGVTACEAHDGIEVEPLQIKTKAGEIHHFNVEVAATPETLMKGLMYRPAMNEDHGMLFLFPKVAERNFWMRNTYIPLDIIFIRESGVINHIHENAVPFDETPLPSKGPILNVLEVNAGVTAKLGIKPGDTIIFPAPPQPKEVQKQPEGAETKEKAPETAEGE